MAWDSPTYPAILFLVVLSLAYAAYARVAAKPSVLESLPWVGLPTGRFSKTRAKWLSLGSGKELLSEAYNQYLKKGLSCVCPSFIGEGHILVPQSEVNWIINQPDNTLNTKEMHRKSLQTDYTLLDRRIVGNALHEDVIRRDLTRQLGSLTEDIMEELGKGFDDYWGFDVENWHEACVFDNMIKIVARTSNRVFVGLPLCRNDDYLTNAANFAIDVPLSGSLIRLFPDFVKPVVAPFITIRNRLHLRRCVKHLAPVITQRQDDMERKRNDPTFKFDEPNDFITWAIHMAQNASDPHERTAEMIAHRIVVVNFAAIHTSTMTITNVLFDLVASPPGRGYLEGIREEVERVLEEDNGNWTKAGLAKLVRTDSAIRESMRRSGFISKAVTRLVVAKDGVTMQNGLHLPHGSILGTSAYSVQMDPAIYEHAEDYDAFRFSRPREAFANRQVSSDEDAQAQKSPTGEAAREDLSELLKHKNLSMVTTGDTFLSFGHGRHACPGRFFAANELKLLLAYMALNYDIKPIAVRPPQKWMGDTVLPPMKATISIKRRKLASVG